MDKIKASQFAELSYLCRYVPPPYQRVEYLQSDSTNDNANSVHIDPNIGYFADFEVDIMRTNNMPTKFMGVDSNYCLQRSGSDGYFAFYYGEWWNSTAPMTTRTVCMWKSGKVYINGTQVKSQSKGYYTGNMVLFGTPGRFFTNIRIYSCKLWDSGGNLVRDMYPCRRRADSVLGFYDTVTETFFPSVGTVGSFIAGSDVN